MIEEILKVKVRICYYKDSYGKYSYYVDDYCDLSGDHRAVWIEADIPIEQIPIKAHAIL